MATVSGRWTRMFAEASHALVCDINLDAMWKHCIMRIEAIESGAMLLAGYDSQVTIERDRIGEYVVIENVCPIGVAFGMKPEKHKARPFKDDRTPAIVQPTLLEVP